MVEFWKNFSRLTGPKFLREYEEHWPVTEIYSVCSNLEIAASVLQLMQSVMLMSNIYRRFIKLFLPLL